MSKSLLHSFIVGMFWSSALAVFTTNDCGVTKSCVFLPAGCDPSQAACSFFSWKLNGADYDMELSGGAGNGATYSAVAFGQVDNMQDADLYYCTGNSFVSGVIRAMFNPPTVLDTNTVPDLTNINYANENGVAKCTFRRPASINKTISGGVAKNFNLTAEEYHILMAKGDVSSGDVERHAGGESNRRITALIDMTGILPTTPASTSTTAAPDAACGNTKGCFQVPEGCSEGSPDCTYFTWAYNSGSNTWNMELSGGAGGGGTYVAVGFGQASVMRDADIYYCTGEDGDAGLRSGAITTLRAAPQQNLAKTGISSIVSSTSNGAAKCTFTRDASVSKPDSSGNQHDYDLSSERYYLLLARGSISGGSLVIHSSRVITSEPADFKTNRASGAAGAETLEKAHGALMIVAWLLLANVGVVIARHFKPLWPELQPGGVKFWFTLHRIIMVLVLLITAAAFIIIFVHVQGYSSQVNSHAIIGIIVMALTLLNPIMALFRPNPNAKNRWIFNFCHRFVGLSARGLGISNLFLGSNAISLSSWAIAVLGGFVGFIALLEIIFEILSWNFEHFSWQKKKKSEEPSDGDMRMEEPNVRVRGQTIKTVLLLIYALGCLAFAITFFVDISNA